ncbi:MAG: hypothetical protein ACM3U2_19915, partial [Deltaproteobacteria bacterium]
MLVTTGSMVTPLSDSSRAAAPRGRRTRKLPRRAAISVLLLGLALLAGWSATGGPAGAFDHL